MPSSAHPDNLESASQDGWASLRTHTPAWIALGRTGGSLRTRAVLSFSLGHALARDAVHASFDSERLAKDLADLFPEILQLESRAGDRLTFLTRPDLGRALSERSVAALAGSKPADLAIVVSDGLSALAANTQAPELLRHLVPALKADGLSIAPLYLVRFARVALQDPLGVLVGATVVLTLIGERPGIGTPDSLGAYFVYGPKSGNTDAQRNCVSNIRAAGLPPKEAAVKLTELLRRAVRGRISGTLLKDSETTDGHTLGSFTAA